MRKAIITGDRERMNVVYGPKECAMIEERVNARKIMCEDLQPGDLAGVEYIFGTWDMPTLDERYMAVATDLKAVFYAAGSVKGFVTDAFWDSDVRLFSAWGANALPVAEFTFAQIILCLKRIWPIVRKNWDDRAMSFVAHSDPHMRGSFGTTVGLLSLGQIGRLVVDRLLTLDVEIIAYDPFISQEEANEIGVKLCSLEEVFARAHVVSCHTPWLKQTEKMLRREHFASMQPASSFINTARGAVVDEEGLISVLRERPDITAVLDVTWPEPPVKESPLYTLPNVVLTPHIAGSVGAECRRMAHYMIAEYDRMTQGLPTHWEITREKAATLA